MAIASIVQGTIEAEGGKVFELDSPTGATWVESVSSFRYVPTGASKPYTVRKEAKKGGDYWYGYRKMAGKLHKKYIGKGSELSTAKLEEIAEALNTPPELRRVTEPVTDLVTEVNSQWVTDSVTDSRTAERVTVLELQVQALRESLEALRSELLGKSKGLSNLEELLNPNKEVTDSELHTELSNLEAENEKLRTDYAALLESSTHVTNKLRQEVQELRSQVEAQKASWDELREELENSETIREEVQAELTAVRSELSDLKQKSATANKDLPDATDVKQESARTSDLSDKAAKVVSFFRPLLNKKAPTNLLSKVEGILEES